MQASTRPRLARTAKKALSADILRYLDPHDQNEDQEQNENQDRERTRHEQHGTKKRRLAIIQEEDISEDEYYFQEGSDSEDEYASQEEHETQEDDEVWEDRRKRPRKRPLFRDHQPLQVQTAAQKTEQDEFDVSYTHDDDSKDETDPQTIGAERLAWSSVHVPFSDDALFDITLTGDDVVRMVETAFPVLSTSNQRIRIFWDSVNQHLQSSPPFSIPVREIDPHTCSLTNPVVDSPWKDAAAAEVALDIPDVYGTIIVAEPASGHFFHW